MKPLFAWLPMAGLAAGSILSASVLLSSTAVAQSCQVDNGGGCLREGMRCNPPQGGKCRTERVGTRELKCTCKARGSGGDNDQPRSERPSRPSGEPSEEQEPQEESPE